MTLSVGSNGPDIPQENAGIKFVHAVSASATVIGLALWI